MPVSNCPRCGVELQASERVCPQCGLLVHVRELDALGKRALQTEAQDPAGAIEIWQQCLPLLPPDSAQARMVQDRIAAISGHLARYGWHPPVGPGVLQTDPARVEPVPRDDPWLLAVSKTVGSMIVSIVLYQLLFKNWLFSIGFVLLILVHEMGHVIAMRRWGLRASPPIFIPFLGALINLREPPPNAKVEAIVGIGGPLLGTVGAMACYLTAHWYLDQGNPVGPVLLQLAWCQLHLNDAASARTGSAISVTSYVSRGRREAVRRCISHTCLAIAIAQGATSEPPLNRKRASCIWRNVCCNRSSAREGSPQRRRMKP